MDKWRSLAERYADADTNEQMIREIKAEEERMRAVLGEEHQAVDYMMKRVHAQKKQLEDDMREKAHSDAATL